MTARRPRPTPDRDSLPWWEALGEHRLLLQRCAGCERRRWPARALCNRCGSLDWDWVDAAGTGRVATWMVNQHLFDPSIPPPYVVVVVRLDDEDDILIPGGYAGPDDGTGLAIDLPVRVGFEDLPGEEGPGATLLRWRPVQGPG